MTSSYSENNKNIENKIINKVYNANIVNNNHKVANNFCVTNE